MCGGIRMSKIDEMTFEDAMEELELVVKQLEDEQLPLEKSIALYERGMQLSKHCDEKLHQAEQKIAVIVDENNEQVPFELEEE